MAIRAAIAHRLNRPDPNQPAEAKLADTIWPENGWRDEICHTVKRSFATKATKQFGHFTPDSQAAGWLNDHLEERQDFLAFSGRLANHVADQISACDALFEGVLLVFIDQRSDDDALFFMALLADEHSFCLNSDMQLITTSHWDPKKASAALQCKMGRWQDGGERYLSSVSSKGDRALSSAWESACGFENSANVAQETKEFLEILGEYGKTQDDEKGKEKTQTAINYCIEQEKSGEPVKLEELSAALDAEQPQEFKEFVTNNQQQPREELLPHRASLKKYLRFSGRDKYMSLSFGAEQLGEQILYDNKTDTLTISHLPKPLKQQLIDHLLQGNAVDNS